MQGLSGRGESRSAGQTIPHLFMIPEGSLPCQPLSVILPYTEPGETNPEHHVLYVSLR